MSPHSGKLVLGIDGGGSKTLASLAVLTDAGEFHIAGRGVAGPSNLNALGIEAAASEVETAIQGAFEAAGTLPRTVHGLCLGMAGAGRQNEQQAWMDWARQNEIADQVDVVTDAETVLAAGTPEGTGIALIAGTGSLAWGKNQAGAEARAGGWGYLLGDEGSGFQIGLAALRAIAKLVDGRGKETCLAAMILGALNLDDARALIPFVYQRELRRDEIAALSRFVFAAAENHDVVAREILRQAVCDLAELVRAVMAQLHDQSGSYALALTGGVLLNQTDYRVALLEQLHVLGAEPATVECVEDASLGAVRIMVRRLMPAE